MLGRPPPGTLSMPTRTFGSTAMNIEPMMPPSDTPKYMIRLASTWAIQQSREIVNTLYHAAGSMAVFEEQPFEQRLRDIHTVAQQSQGRQLHYETVGQILFGMEPENQF